MYGNSAQARGWLVPDISNSRFSIGSANSGGVRITISSGQQRHTDFTNSIDRTQGTVLEIGANTTSPNTQFGATIKCTASEDNGTDIVHKSTIIQTFYHDVPGRNISTNLNVDSTNVFQAYNTGVLETNTIELRDSSILKPVNGSSLLDLRVNNTDDTARLHTDNTLYLTTGFRQRLIIGHMGNAANTLLPSWGGSNTVYSQVQISNVNFRGGFTIGTGPSTTSTIIGIGSEYTQLRWGTFRINPADALNLGHTSLQSTFSVLNFTDTDSNSMMRISGQRNRLLEINHSVRVLNGSNTNEFERKADIELKYHYWTKAIGDLTGITRTADFKITQERFSINAGVDFLDSYTSMSYGNNEGIRIYENGEIGFENLPTSAPSEVNKVWNDAGILKIT